jgi:hypothetical protein
MDKKRKAYAPFSLTSEAGVAQTPVEGYIDVNQSIYPTVNTGVVNENGKWTGVKSDDIEFKGLTKDLLVANGAAILTPTGPKAKDNFINMSGFTALQIALKVTRAGSYGLTAVFGPSNSESTYLNLSPFAAEQNITVNDGISVGFGNALADGGETLTADAWHIFTILERAKGQVNMQLKITNGSGGDSDIEFAYRRLV